MSQYDELVEFLRTWLYDHPELGIHANNPRWHPRPVSALPSAVELAEELVDSAEFRSLQLGTWLGTTEGQVIEQAVATVIPPMFRPQYALVVAGLKLGADLQRDHGERVAGTIAVGALVAGMCLVLMVAIRRT